MQTFDRFRQLVSERQPKVALVMGSGLSELAQRLRDSHAIAFQELPDFDTGAGVAGHRGELLLGEWAGTEVLLFAGRLHYYEGHPWRRVLAPIHLAHSLGVKTLILTNAAGGIREDLVPGGLMLLSGHLQWTLADSWRHLEPTTEPYAREIAGTLKQAASDIGMSLPSGVYAQLTGPSYETPSEIRALAHWGADAVGMSTAREAMRGSELGMSCAAISFITNKAAGLSDGPIHHGEVLETGKAGRDRLAHLLERYLQRIVSNKPTQ